MFLEFCVEENPDCLTLDVFLAAGVDLSYLKLHSPPFLFFDLDLFYIPFHSPDRK